MKISYRSEPATTENLEKVMAALISDTEATYFSRLPGELIASIPSSNRDGGFTLVWLASSEGAYTSKIYESKKKLAQTLVFGEWQHQPDVEIIIDRKQFASPDVVCYSSATITGRI